MSNAYWRMCWTPPPPTLPAKKKDACVIKLLKLRKSLKIYNKLAYKYIRAYNMFDK